MPGFDGTGPFGQGPMTGRGNGYCVAPVNSIKNSCPTRNFSYRTPLRYGNMDGDIRRGRFYHWRGWQRGRGRGFAGGRWW